MSDVISTTTPSTGPVDRFVRPHLGWYLALEPGIGLLTAMSASQRAYDAVRARVPVPSRRTVQVITGATAAVHVVEARSAYRRARALGMTRSAPRWALETFLCGFPVLLSLSNQAATAQE